MKPSYLLSALALLALAPTAPAVDLSKVPRTIGREPAYRSKLRYCLLVFGPRAKTRVWLVQDGDTLYVDRNGNGDLTEAGEKVAAEKSEDAEEGVYTFKAGDLRDGELLHKELTLSVRKIESMLPEDAAKELLKKDPKARAYVLYLEVDVPGRKGAGIGNRVQQVTSPADGTVLQFAERPQDAPIIHFGGPWQITLSGKDPLTIDRETDVALGVGSPGLGAGTFAWTYYDHLIPTDKFPTLDIVYQPKHLGDPPLREHYELKHRC
jgi:hypothetical protein